MSARTRVVLLVLGVTALTIGLVLGLRWWTHGRFVQTTNDAYLQADSITIAPRVQGYVEQVFVRDNEAVAAGQPLLKVATDSYDAALAQQQAAVDARIADIAAAERQVQQQQAAVERSRADLAGAETTAVYAAREAQRYRTLAAQGVETATRGAEAKNQADQAAATVTSNAAAVRQARSQIATLQAQVDQAKAQAQAAQAQVRSAQINVNDAVLHARVAGRVGDKTVRVGQFVQPGMRLMSVVPVQDIYLVANFKETQVGRIRIGQTATVKIDALGGRTIDAVVDSFAPGTGAQFALLPPENATGNFTKVVQRVPVRLRLRPPADVRDHLLPGLSATVKVDTTQPIPARS